jgi:hypothetical protein
MMLRIREWRRETTMSPNIVRVQVRVRRRRDGVLIWTSGSCSVGVGQETHERRATKDMALQMTIGAGKVNMKRVTIRATEPE